MTNELKRDMQKLIARLEGMASAYRTYANRRQPRALGPIPQDGFYSTRIGDHDNAIKLARKIEEQL